jgi:hypothetical protein
MAMATVMGDCNSNGDSNGVGDGNGDGHGKGDHYEGRVASSCGGNVQRFWRGDVVPMEITFMDNGGNTLVLDEFIEQMNSYI